MKREPDTAAGDFLDTVDWLGPYEQMRKQAVEGENTRVGWGRAILVHRGMAAWMRAWSALPARTPEKRPAFPATFFPPPTLEVPAEYYGPIAAILTSMFLETRPEVLA
jgi:hypothetical protein